MVNYRHLIARLQRIITRPEEELSRTQRSLRYSIDLTRHCFEELRYDQATQMAAALTYRTIFSLVPIFVLSLIVFQSSHAFSQTRQEFQNGVIQYLGLNAISPTGPENRPKHPQAGAEEDEEAPATREASGGAESAPAGGTTADEQQEEAQRSINNILDHLTRRISKVSVGSISVVGLLLLIWAALALVITVEQAFNRIYDCTTGRAWHLRIPIYWAVITLGPVLLTVSIYVAGQASAVAQAQLGPLGTVMGQLSRFAALAASWLLLFLMYRLLPNTRVQTRQALIGSFVAAVLWETVKWGFKFYVARAVAVSQLYGSLGLIPLFLFWVYLTWMIVLFGLELTYTLQAMKGHSFKHEAHGQDRHVIIEAAWVLPVMSEVARAFGLGKTVSVLELSRRLGLPQRAVSHLTQKLEEAGMLLHVQAERGSDTDAGYSLVRPPEKIKIADLLDVGGRLAAGDAENRDHPGFAYMARLDLAQRQAAGDATLASLNQTQPGQAC